MAHAVLFFAANVAINVLLDHDSRSWALMLAWGGGGLLFWHWTYVQDLTDALLAARKESQK